MGGGAIVLLTLIAVGIVVFLIWLSFWLLERLNVLFNDTEGEAVAKVLLFIPYVILTVWCVLLHIVLLIITLGAAAGALNNMRDWWHKGK